MCGGDCRDKNFVQISIVGNLFLHIYELYTQEWKTSMRKKRLNGTWENMYSYQQQLDIKKKKSKSYNIE